MSGELNGVSIGEVGAPARNYLGGLSNYNRDLLELVRGENFTNTEGGLVDARAGWG